MKIGAPSLKGFSGARKQAPLSLRNISSSKSVRTSSGTRNTQINHNKSINFVKNHQNVPLKNQTSLLTLKPLSRSRSIATQAAAADDAIMLCKAASDGNLKVIQNLADSGFDINKGDYDKRTALHLACAEGRTDVVRYLIEKGAKVNAVDRWGGTPLDDAIRGGHKGIMEMLQKAGGKMGSNLPSDKLIVQRGLFDAAVQGNLALLQKSLDQGADINQGDPEGRTALHFAAFEGREELVQHLISKGAKVNAVDRFGSTPLQNALSRKTAAHGKVVQLLESAGAVLNKDMWRLKNTPEFQSSIQKSLPLLCERGNWLYAEVWIPNDDESMLVGSDSWYADKTWVNKFSTLRHAVEGASLKPDETLLGKVWKSKKASWIGPDIDNVDLREKNLLKEVGVKSGLAVPIVYNDKVLAVLVFFANDARPPDNQLLDYFREFCTGLIKVGISRAISPTFGSQPSAEQMNVVYNLIVEEGVFNGTVVYQELDWFYNGLGLQPYYFERFSPQAIAKHLHSYIAAKKLAQATGKPEDIRLTMEQKDGSGAFYLCATDHEAMVHVEQKIERLIERQPVNKAYTLTFFRSKGTAIPNGTRHLGLYIFDTAEYVDKNAGENDTDIWKIATGVFLRDKTPAIRERYQDIIKKSVKHLAPTLEVYPQYRDGTIPLMFTFKMGAHTSYLSHITELLKHNNLTCERKFIETFANGTVVYSLYLHPCEKSQVKALLDQVSHLHLVPKSPLTQVFLNGDCNAEEYLYGSAVTRCIYYFLHKPSEEFNMLALKLKDDPMNLGRLSLLQTTLRRAAISQNRIFQCLMNYPVLWALLYEDFEKCCQSLERPQYNKELSSMIKKEVANELDERILLTFLTFNSCVLKTNFYARQKSAVAFRLDPSIMADTGNYPEIPFAVFFNMGLDFQGFHVRFRDVARGGIRIIKSGNEQSYNRNLETQFAETYNLAYTQNKKNKDIAEFGSKGTILLNWSPVSQKNTFLSFQKYISALLDLMLKDQEGIVDHYKNQEILFFGPDEGTADYMQWAAEYAGQRGYPFWLALTTGKPLSLGGIPHDKYGMTTRGVRRYVLGCLAKAGLDETKVTKLQTGGPDGDLGSNEILMSREKTIGVIDGSGVLFDPNGINRTELTKLARAKKMIAEFDSSLIGAGGFRVLIGDKSIKLPNGELIESGFTFRNEFHLHPLSSADLFVPCGGRPESVNLKNVNRMFHKDGTPRFRFIIEGANLFLTPDARMMLENAGVVLYKDASANKGGVTSSSLEVLSALALSPEEHKKYMQVTDPNNPPKFYQNYVEAIKARIAENADLEFECIWKEHELTKIPRYILTDKISDKINLFNDAITNSDLWNNKKLREKILSEAIPNTLCPDLLDLNTIMQRVPESYMRAIFSAYLASRYVYAKGLNAPEFAFYEFIQPYLFSKE